MCNKRQHLAPIVIPTIRLYNFEPNQTNIYYPKDYERQELSDMTTDHCVWLTEQ